MNQDDDNSWLDYDLRTRETTSFTFCVEIQNSNRKITSIKTFKQDLTLYSSAYIDNEYNLSQLETLKKDLKELITNLYNDHGFVYKNFHQEYSVGLYNNNIIFLNNEMVSCFITKASSSVCTLEIIKRDNKKDHENDLHAIESINSFILFE